MTDHTNTEALPNLLRVPESFTARIPTQRFLDLVRRMEPAVPFPELAQTQPFRLIAFRALLRDYPDRDATSLWLHAYDVEVETVPEDPTNGKPPTLSPPFVDIGAAFPTTPND